MTPKEYAEHALANSDLERLELVERETLISSIHLVVEAAVIEEREACAKECDDVALSRWPSPLTRGQFEEALTELAETIAERIRARRTP